MKTVMLALTTKEIALQLKAVPEWSKRGRKIHRLFEFQGFLSGIAFVNRVAKKAQKLNHHPDIVIRFNQVTLTLTTHDVGGLTGEDFLLARQCDDAFTAILKP